jgi:hypothetical protein
MKKILLILFTIVATFSLKAQCVGVQSATVSPLGPYTGGTVITFCYTMTGWNGLNVGNNWLEGFDINVSAGLIGVTPIAPPVNCNGGGGTWLWRTVVNTPSGTVGPGWFFEAPLGGPTDGNPANDYGDFGSCTWTFCFQATVVQGCNPLPITAQVTAGADGDWGTWINNTCPTTPYTILNTVSNPTPVITSPIFH